MNNQVNDTGSGEPPVLFLEKIQKQIASFRSYNVYGKKTTCMIGVPFGFIQISGI
jgi:hypothetical protein